MPQLIIVRHAKTIDRSEVDEDFDRYLTERGHADAKRTAEALAAAGLIADTALVSPARRTRETWRHLSQALGDIEPVSPLALYHASMEMLMRLCSEQLEAGAESLAVIGHNPGIGALAHEMAARAGTLSGWPAGFPTSMAAAFRLSKTSNTLNAVEEILRHDPKA